ncbi:hypothetical protein [Defluviimonas sp. SAOS-178_SWC]|uniref:hypothetical protein n=1 Tax=Defluviimonas sp. SAOS-178_SWC TaxID=3121287 RepID=UPI0032213B1B
MRWASSLERMRHSRPILNAGIRSRAALDDLLLHELSDILVVRACFVVLADYTG